MESTNQDIDNEYADMHMIHKRSNMIQLLTCRISTHALQCTWYIPRAGTIAHIRPPSCIASESPTPNRSTKNLKNEFDQEELKRASHTYAGFERQAYLVQSLVLAFSLLPLKPVFLDASSGDPCCREYISFPFIATACPLVILFDGRLQTSPWRLIPAEKIHNSRRIRQELCMT